MSTHTLDFPGLVAAIRQANDALAEQASRAVNVSLTLRNWFIGYYIAEFELQGADRANYGDRLLDELALALRGQAVSNCGRRQLYAYLAFYRTYPQIVRTASALSAPISTVDKPHDIAVTAKAREALGLSASFLFRLPEQPNDPGTGYYAGPEDGRPRPRN